MKQILHQPKESANNKRMLEQIATDSNPSIRKELTKRKDLPPYIVEQLICDQDADIRLEIIASQLLTKEQIKLYAKEDDVKIAAFLFAKYVELFDDELVEYFVKNGSNEIKEQLSFQTLSKIDLTDEQIEFLSQLENSNLRTKENLITYHKLSENIINFLLSLNNISLIRQIAYYRSDLTKSMIDKIIESNDTSVMLSIFQNRQLCSQSLSLYQYATSQMLFKSDDIGFLNPALSNYAKMQNTIYLKLSTELIEHLIQLNYKKCNFKLTNMLLRVRWIPQHLVECIFNSLINCETALASIKERKEYEFWWDVEYLVIFNNLRKLIINDEWSDINKLICNPSLR